MNPYTPPKPLPSPRRLAWQMSIYPLSFIAAFLLAMFIPLGYVGPLENQSLVFVWSAYFSNDYDLWIREDRIIVFMCQLALCNLVAFVVTFRSLR